MGSLWVPLACQFALSAEVEQVFGPPGFHPAGWVYGRRCYGPEYCHHPLQGSRHCPRGERDFRPYGPGEVSYDDSGRYHTPSRENFLNKWSQYASDNISEKILLATVDLGYATRKFYELCLPAIYNYELLHISSGNLKHFQTSNLNISPTNQRFSKLQKICDILIN